MHDQHLTGLFDRYRRRGDLSALAKLFDEVSPEMMRVAHHVAGQGIDPEDVVQATFLTAIERAESYDAERPLVPWLMGILINQARLMKRRRVTRHEQAPPTELESSAYEPEDAEAHEVQDAVARALADLPPVYREVLVAHLAEGKPPHEIARDLGRPQGTVRAQIHRGLRLVRRALPSGFAFGALALLDRSALAGARRVVLESAARAQSLPASAIPAASSSKLGAFLVAACLVLAVAVGIAWLGGRSARTGDEVDIATSTTHGAGLELQGAATRARVAADEFASVAPPAAEPQPARAPRAGSVRVAVLDALGQPAAGVRVDLLAWGDPFWHESVRSALTDAVGTADFPRVPAGTIGVHLDGGGVQSRAPVQAGERTEVTIHLERGIDFSGIVLDRRGTPIEGALVEAGPDPLTAPRHTSAPTGPDGRFQLRDVGRALAVWARAEARPPSEAVWYGTPPHAATPSAELRFSLADPVLPFAFTIVDPRGAPVAGAIVTAFGAAGDAAFQDDGSVVLARGGARAVSGADGAVRFAVDRAHTRHVTIEAPPLARREIAVRDVGTLVQLEEGARFVGVARFEDGLPAEEARVEAFVDGFAEPLRARSGASGAWEIAGLPAGGFTLRARAAPDAPSVETRGVARAGEEFRWDPRLQHTLVIQGVARSADGRAAKTWLVKAVREDADPGPLPPAWLGPDAADLRQCYTQDDGSFSVPCAAGATYRLELRPRANWNGPVLGAVDGVRAGARDVSLRVRRERGYASARFLDAAGRPAAALLIAVHRGSGAVHSADAGPDGRVERDLHPGRYALFAWPAGRAPIPLGEREVGEDHAVEIGDVRVDATGSIRIRGAPDRPYLLRGPSDLPYRLRPEGPDLVARGLPPGAYTLLGSRADGSSIERHAQLETEGELVLD